ncbi:MAG: GerAB/ArcD/ProY family transporter [Bacillota bacterium]
MAQNKRSLLSSNQIAMIMAGSALMFPYTFLPVVRTPPANQDVWIVSILTVLFIVILNYPLLFIINRFRGFNINETNEIIMGRAGGKITASFFVLFSVFCYIACMSIASIFIATYILVETPLWIILLFILVPATFASIKGAGTIGRMAFLIIPLMLLTIIIFFVVGISDMDIDMIKPILSDSKISDILLGSFITAARYSEILILFVFAYYLKKKASINATYFKGMIIFGVFFLIVTISTLLMLGPEISKISNNPFLAYARQVGGQEFLQRVHLLNIMAWFIGIVIKLIAYNYAACHIFAGIIRSKSHKYFVFPLSIIAYIIALLPFMKATTTIHLLTADTVFPFVVLGVVVVIPLVLLVVYLIRKKKIDKIISKRIKNKNKQIENFYKEKASVEIGEEN